MKEASQERREAQCRNRVSPTPTRISWPPSTGGCSAPASGGRSTGTWPPARRAAARLAHPHIVHAYDAEQAGDAHFLVMEYVDGVSLDRLIREKGPAPVAAACDWVRQAALGLQHAYERGMVHRDIKPGNLMLT